MPIIRKRRIWWEPVSEATSYVVYVTQRRPCLSRISLCGRRLRELSPRSFGED